MSIGVLSPPHDFNARAESIPAATGEFEPADAEVSGPRELQLEVFVNGTSRELIAAFRQDSDGSLAIEPDQLRNVGVYPADEAMRLDGLIEIARLPGVSFDYDEASQSIHFNVEYDALSARVIDAHEGVQDDNSTSEAQSSVGALVNYTLFASTGGDGLDDIWEFEGVSGWFEGRAFSPLGVFTTSYIASTSSSDIYNSTRLDTTWSYSSPKWMTTFRAGDVITGGLSWTRPTRLGGLQI